MACAYVGWVVKGVTELAVPDGGGGRNGVDTGWGLW